jgi:hypothetical protein
MIQLTIRPCKQNTHRHGGPVEEGAFAEAQVTRSGVNVAIAVHEGADCEEAQSLVDVLLGHI